MRRLASSSPRHLRERPRRSLATERCLSCAVVLVLMTCAVLAQADKTVSIGFAGPADLKAWTLDGGEWAVRDGCMEQTTTGSGWAFWPERAFSDVSVAVEFRAWPEGSGVKAAGVIFRSTDSQSFYGVHFDAKHSQVVLWSSPYVKGDWVVVKRVRQKIEENVWHAASVTAKGKELRVTLDGQEIISAQDERYADGVIGLYASQGHVAFRNLKVSGAPVRKEWKLVPKPYQIVCSDGGGGAYEAFPDLCRLKNGDLLCVFYEGYGHVSLPNEQLPKGGRVCSVRSSDEGRTWGKAEIVADTPFDDRDPHICQLSDGTLICNFFSYYAKGKRREGSPHPFEILTTRSTDGGHTWSEPQLVEINSPLAWACSAPIRELPDKSLIMGIYHESGAGAFGGTIKSYDRGKTWT
ncbi:MAG: DUF1080 domain-containing protein, partial [Planctomycetes bacterium]|nr:DUF1080 domain-containing protein [Planctomycetota bacterium]